MLCSNGYNCEWWPESRTEEGIEEEMNGEEEAGSDHAKPLESWVSPSTHPNSTSILLLAVQISISTPLDQLLELLDLAAHPDSSSTMRGASVDTHLQNTA